MIHTVPVGRIELPASSLQDWRNTTMLNRLVIAAGVEPANPKDWILRPGALTTCIHYLAF